MINELITLSPRKAFRQLQEYLIELRSKGEMEAIGELIKDLSLLSEAPPILLVGALRVTFLCREDVPYWNESLDTIRKQLKKRGLDEQSLLIGLSND